MDIKVFWVHIHFCLDIFVSSHLVYIEQLKIKLKQLTGIYYCFGACPKYEFSVESSIHTMVLFGTLSFILKAFIFVSFLLV